jgi:hypothetical protein
MAILLWASLRETVLGMLLSVTKAFYLNRL